MAPPKKRTVLPSGKLKTEPLACRNSREPEFPGAARGRLHALLQVVVVFVVAIAPVESRSAWLDAVLIEPTIPSNLFGLVPVRPPTKISALQDDVWLFLIDELIQSPKVGVNVARGDDLHDYPLMRQAVIKGCNVGMFVVVFECWW
jgi:hypothetical protein